MAGASFPPWKAFLAGSAEKYRPLLIDEASKVGAAADKEAAGFISLARSVSR
jgi:hypothetical protein